ncbi:polysaccharide deacetylase family protein [Actinokineospora pegani]|uniref:polysaccharide deacetylase family protein n=1 Tax=Actinokineospora pegani TaxID=2654637 RepID=UPI0012E9C0F4|nr:polysaccharide deacetylase family protein [Actinokineospora pegani]
MTELRTAGRVSAAVAVLALATACAGSDAAGPGAPATSVTPEAQVTSTSPPPPAPQEVSANELGQVPVLMYHRVVADPRSVYDRTPADFRAELERLAGEGYVTVTAAQYAKGEIDIPAGAHPVVLTFDDADPSQFALAADGSPVAGTAVAIMREVAAAHPDFRGVGSFFVNADPFGDPGGLRTIPWLRAHGMEVGNHTLTHVNLRTAGPAAAQQDIARGDQAIRRAGGEPEVLALPFGILPSEPGLAVDGAADGVEYHYRGALLVGANPAPSPYSGDFDPVRIPRIRSQAATGKEAELASTVWLDKLAADPASRFTSDGVAERVSFPQDAGVVADAFQARAQAY